MPFRLCSNVPIKTENEDFLTPHGRLSLYITVFPRPGQGSSALCSSDQYYCTREKELRPKNDIENIGVNGIDKPNGDLKPKTWLDVTYGSGAGEGGIDKPGLNLTALTLYVGDISSA